MLYQFYDVPIQAWPAADLHGCGARLQRAIAEAVDVVAGCGGTIWYLHDPDRCAGTQRPRVLFHWPIRVGDCDHRGRGRSDGDLLASSWRPTLLGRGRGGLFARMALVPIIQPMIMRALTTEAERQVVMSQLRAR